MRHIQAIDMKQPAGIAAYRTNVCVSFCVSRTVTDMHSGSGALTSRSAEFAAMEKTEKTYSTRGEC